jgi:hypothetical protein
MFTVGRNFRNAYPKGKNMRIGSVVAVVLLGTALTGCASIIKGSSQQIAISTPPAAGATCTLKNARGEWTVTTPAAVTVKRSKKDVEIACTKDGFQDASAVIPSGFEEWTLGNVLAGGVIGFGVDAGTGSINKYPSTFEVPMTQKAASTPSSPSAAAKTLPAKSSASPTS